MKRAALSLMLSFAVAGSLYAAQAQQPSSPAPSAPAPAAGAAQAPAPPAAAAQASQDKAADITLTGCLIQGSSPTVWILENAKLSTASATDKGKSYVVVVTGAADLKPHLNHQVRIVGAENAAVKVTPTPGGAQVEVKATDEASFPRLTARTVTMVAATCPA